MLSGRIVSQCRSADVHADEDVPLLDRRPGAGAAGRDRLDVEAAAELGRGGGDVLGVDRRGLQAEDPPDLLAASTRRRSTGPPASAGA